MISFFHSRDVKKIHSGQAATAATAAAAARPPPASGFFHAYDAGHPRSPSPSPPFAAADAHYVPSFALPDSNANSADCHLATFGRTSLGHPQP